jgi:copper chaperone
MTTTTTYTVSGMACGHCVQSVTDEFSVLPGVDTVLIDLPSGAVTVTSAGSLDPGAVRAAVDEAGYHLADAT